MNYDNNAVFMDEFTKLAKMENEAFDPPDFCFSTQMWTSLMTVSVLALIHKSFGVSVAGDKLVECKSINEVLKLIEASNK